MCPTKGSVTVQGTLEQSEEEGCVGGGGQTRLTFRQSTVKRFCQVLIKTPHAFKGTRITSMAIEACTHGVVAPSKEKVNVCLYGGGL